MKRLLYGWIALVLVTAHARGAESFVIQPDDVLTVSVYGHEDLSRDVVVLSDGYVNYPVIGRVQAAGNTPEELSRLMEKGLLVELLHPKVTVSVRQPAMRRVYISGLIAKPGSYDLKAGWRVSHIIAEAGGLTTKPELVKAGLVRGKETIPVDIAAILAASSPDTDIALKPGDLLQIQADTNLVHVAGQVKQPGDYQVKNNLGVVEAVAMAGGPTDSAALTRAQVIRDGQAIKVDLYALLVEGKVAGNVALKPGDTVLVPANSSRIAVLGGVQQPGFFELPDGKAVTVADAIALAHGANRRAKTDSVSLVRSEGDKQTVTQVNLSRFLKDGDLTQNPLVRAGDVVYVRDNSKPDGTSVLQTLTSIATPLLYLLR